MQFSPGQLASFTHGYRHLFRDHRLFQGFQALLWGIIASGSCRISRIASSNPLTAHTPHAERRLRRLVHGHNQRADLRTDDLSLTFTQQGAARLENESEVLLLMDESNLRKPHARQLQHLDTVQDLEGRLVAGFHTLNVLGIGATGTRALLFHNCFSTLAHGFTSINHQVRHAVTQVASTLRQHGIGRLLWVLDRAYDDLELMRHLEESGQCFVIRAQHFTRRATRVPGGKIRSLEAHLDAAPVLASVTLERVMVEPGSRRRGSVMLDVRAVAVELTRAPGLPLTVVRLEHPQLPGWVLLSNLRWPERLEEQQRLVVRLVSVYRQRWAVEDTFAWSKGLLGWEEVQLLSYEALRTLVAFSWVAAAFLFELSGDLEGEEVRFLARLGGWTGGKRRPGRRTLTQGLRHLCSYLLIEQHLRDPVGRRSVLALQDRLFRRE